MPCVVVAIVLGHLARSEIRKHSNIKGKGLATAALIISYTYLTCIVAITIDAVVHLSGMLWDYKKEQASIPKIPVAQLSFEDPGLNACIHQFIRERQYCMQSARSVSPRLSAHEMPQIML